MKYFLIAGEASGDLHASNLIRALQEHDKLAVFVGLGGDKMREAGCTTVQDYREMAFMGFAAVLRNLKKIRRNFNIAYEALLQEKPDVLILIDYPSFNLKVAAWCKKHLPQTKICYYIPPKVWAWKRWRVHKIARLSDEILGIFPFEPAFYAQYGYEAKYVGNPTAEGIRNYKQQVGEAPQREKIIAILPGSRRHEIANCLPKMLEAAKRFPDYRIIITGAPGIEPTFYKQWVGEEQVVFDETYHWVQRAEVAIVNSGTATLETALLGCPQVAVYHVEWGRLLGILRPIMFQIPHFTLVNIIPEKEVIKEMIAYLFTVDNVANEVERILHDTAYRQQMLAGYAEIEAILGTQDAAPTASEIIIDN